jgi:peptidyl-prolyl cis-trans isomerase A (cyclophilin A)
MRRIVTAICLTTLLGATLSAQTGTRHPRPRTTHRAVTKASLLNPASLKEQAPASYKVKFATTKGDFVVEVTRAWSPRGADRFYNLVKHHFYDDASFFRVLPGFVAQFGISASPAVSRAWAKATIPDDPVTQSNLRRTLTFATAGPNTRTTQVFINLADNAGLDKMGFSPFGKVIEGMDVVDKFYSGYGEGAPQGSGPDQGRITNEGKAYLSKDFPLLDRIKTTAIVP